MLGNNVEMKQKLPHSHRHKHATRERVYSTTWSV